MAAITPDVLSEALATDEGRSALREALAPAVAEAVRELDLGSEVVSLVEAKLEGDREVIRAEASARADRRNELRDMRDLAHRKIDESKLSPRLKTRAKSRFDLVEGAPTADLDIVNDEDESGHVVKSAQAKLAEAVEQEIREGLDVMAEIHPTRVTGQGTRLVEGGGGEKEGEHEQEKPDTVGPVTRSLLEAQGIPADEVEEVYARSL